MLTVIKIKGAGTTSKARTILKALGCTVKITSEQALKVDAEKAYVFGMLDLMGVEIFTTIAVSAPEIGPIKFEYAMLVNEAYIDNSKGLIRILEKGLEDEPDVSITLIIFK